MYLDLLYHKRSLLERNRINKFLKIKILILHKNTDIILAEVL